MERGSGNGGGSRAIRVRVSDEEEPPEIAGAGVFEVVENTDAGGATGGGGPGQAGRD